MGFSTSQKQSRFHYLLHAGLCFIVGAALTATYARSRLKPLLRADSAHALPSAPTYTA